MTDREMLELAAKAAGIVTHGWRDDGRQSRRSGYFVEPEQETGAYTVWNPLTDDGDVLRLAVKLRLSIDFAPHDVGPYVCAWRHGVEMMSAPVSVVEDFHAADGDPDAATRRAIVRAAAEIWMGMRPFPTADEIRENWT